MRNFLTLLTSVALFFMGMLVHADELNLLQVQGKSATIYEQPDLKSKVVETLASGSTIIPIFEQKDWFKVANPKDGAVGWLPKNALEQGTQVLISVGHPADSQYIVTQKNKAGDVVGTYRIIQYSNGKPLDQQQAEALFKQVQEQQRQIQEKVNKAFAESFKNFDANIQSLMSDPALHHFPMVQPIIVIQPAKDSVSAPAPKK